MTKKNFVASKCLVKRQSFSCSNKNAKKSLLFVSVGFANSTVYWILSTPKTTDMQSVINFFSGK